MKCSMTSVRAAAALLVLATAPSAVPAADSHTHSQKGASHAHEAKPQHGGVIAEAQETTYELVLKPDGAIIYVTDHGKPMSTQGAKASLLILTGSKKTELDLVPAATNELRGTADLKDIVANAKVAATIALAGKKPVNVRFATRP